MSIDNSDDIIDSRDVISRIEELTSEREGLTEALTAAQEALTATVEGEESPMEEAAAQEAVDAATTALEEWDGDNAAELNNLEALQEQAEGYASDWRHGEQLIRDSYFESYARELAEDLHGNKIRDAEWPFSCIDWDRAVRELQMDYTSVDFDGVTYWVR
jgi:hypothetical protein